MENIKGIIFDYGGTIDSRGDHWSEVIYDQYCAVGIDVEYDDFRQAYIHAERALARERIVLPCDNFAVLMQKKIAIQLQYLADKFVIDNADVEKYRDAIARLCYEFARDAVDEVRPYIKQLSQKYPLALVSNFYGNIDEVLRDFDLRDCFTGIVESSVIGIRKPDARIFSVGCMVLGLQPSEVLVVGDTLSKDIVPAQSLGCATAYICGRPWRGETVADVAHESTTIRHLAERLLN